MLKCISSGCDMPLGAILLNASKDYSVLEWHLQQYLCEKNKKSHKIFNTAFSGVRLLPFLQGRQRDFHDL